MNEKTFLISRTDRAGDLLLTLPIFREIRKSFPNARLIAHVRSYTAPILKLCPEVDQVVIDDNYKAGIWSSQLVSCVKTLKVDYAILVHPSGRSILSMFRAGIKKRTGRASNIWQVFLNDRRIQKRSRNEKHEFMYNLDLLTNIISDIDYKPYRLMIPDKMKQKAAYKIAEMGLENAIIIHPGHGGSALNLSVEQYSGLAKILLDNNEKVIVSLGPGEEKQRHHFPNEEKGKIGFLTRIPNMSELAALFSTAKAFVGGSTGPLHLASGINLPTLAFFPPVKAMTPVRWGPVGNDSLVIKPDVGRECFGKCDKCSIKNCMAAVNMIPAVNWLLQNR